VGEVHLLSTFSQSPVSGPPNAIYGEVINLCIANTRQTIDQSNCVLCALSGSKLPDNVRQMSFNGGLVIYCPSMQQLADIYFNHFQIYNVLDKEKDILKGLR